MLRHGFARRRAQRALGIGILVLLLKLMQERPHCVPHMRDATESQVVLGVLTMVDLSLTASLLVIVMFSGIEILVSQIDHAEHKDWAEHDHWLAWMGRIDVTGVKLKRVSSIVAISAISLLKAFMDLKAMSDRNLSWLVGIHMLFVVSGLLMALADRLIAGHHDR